MVEVCVGLGRKHEVLPRVFLDWDEGSRGEVPSGWAGTSRWSLVVKGFIDHGNYWAQRAGEREAVWSRGPVLFRRMSK